MKYPEYRLSMEAALPSSVHSWFTNELDQRGIDSLVYTRYIISLLLQNEDLDCEADIFCTSKTALKGKARKPEKKNFSISEEEKRKLAAIECLLDVSEEKSDIKGLIDELCMRLKDSEAQATVSPVIKSQSSSSDSSEDSGTENQNSTERYYAAFPSLHGKSSPSSGSSVAVESVWKNNPLVKSVLSTEHSTEDSCSSNDDLEVKKINKSPSVTVPKYKKTRKNISRSNKEYTEHRKAKTNAQKSKPLFGMQNKGERFKKDSPVKPWPPGFAKLDLLQGTCDAFGEDIDEIRTETPKRPNEELCTKVECILKGMLLPAPEKTYKDLQDVDIEVPSEQLERVDVSTTQSNNGLKISESFLPLQKSSNDVLLETESQPVTREASVSPELQEQEIWYTQPIAAIFQSPNEDEDVGCSKLRLYKRNSYPIFSPESNDGKEADTDMALSSSSSPVFDRSRCDSTSTNGSENILEGSVYMPSWLTEEISVDQNQELSTEVQQAYLSSSFHSSSPFPHDSDAVSHFSHSLDSTFATEDTAWGEGAFSIPPPAHGNDHLTLDTDLYNPWSVHSDENLTPTPDEGKTADSEKCSSTGPSLSVSLVDWNYLSHFLCESDITAFCMEDGFTRTAAPRRTCLSSLSDNQVVFDFSLDVDDYSSPQLGMFGIYWLQPMWNEEHSLSQLWDVNMQKRSKVSPWGCPSFFSGSQVWVTENTFVLYNTNSANTEAKDGQEESENTLIPWISIDVLAEPSTNSLQDTEKKADDVDKLTSCFDRSISLSDVPAFFEEGMNSNEPDPKLSKSFELVPSETSAFYDVPRRLLHVHSEPNLVQFRQDCSEGNQSLQHSPQEHLYFSPKTHFRPITPAFAPELSTSKAKQQVCHDLFGGLPSTKTPYQQFHNYEDTSDEDTFVPKFKVKNSCKSIQTGDSVDNPDSQTDSSDTTDRDTPQTLTMGIIEDVMGDKDDSDWLVPISEDLEAANADSAYETDYGLSAIDSEQDDSSRPSQGHCSFRGKKTSFTSNLTNCGVDDHGNLGDGMNYTIESFLATYPHTQDWPDISQSCDFSSGHTQWSDKDNGQFQMASSWPQPHVFPEHSADQCQNEAQESCLLERHDSWISDLFSDHQYDGDAESYKNTSIWTTGDDEIGAGFHFDLSNFQEEFDARLACGESSPQISSEVSSSDCTHCHHDVHNGGVAAQCCEPRDKTETDETNLPQSGIIADNLPVTVKSDEVEWLNPGDYFSVKLVYKDKKSIEDHSKECQKSYGSFDLMPMPGEAVLSTELEKEWMDPNAVFVKPSSLQRKPCSFYLEGNCRRADCKFAHDISNITCRFWEDGDCFKGPLCPFLHGYPRITSPSSSILDSEGEMKDRFSLNTEEFPELALSVKNGNTVSKRISKPIKGVAPVRREKVRKSSSRRHSNKENKAESRLMDKCSSSV